MNKNTCPCCGYNTMDTDGDYDICPICFWEDDPFQKENEYDLGANQIPLIEAQQNYIQYGACEKEFIKNVRKPDVQDRRDPNWQAINDPLYEVKLACRKFKEGRYNIGELERNLSWIAVPPEAEE
ncbi:CPCC family cysteine-rich protein [Aneurinibacillus sp. REN35]|uniref:CPCC family cysteine-rich protein n=1 Tax=Aneurinibacillus sp. REN35 TaxID=3237286 RepID=UPI0035282981